MRNLVPILLAVVVFSSGCDPDGYSCNSDGCYEDNDNPQYQTLEDCNSMCDEQIPGGCGSPVLHEEYLYSTVQIGNQCWFAENCRYLPEVSSPSSTLGTNTESDPNFYVYDYDGNNVEEAKATENYSIYGVLYTWPAVMTEGVCPSGWHIPSDTEFTELIDFLGGAENGAADLMTSISGWPESTEEGYNLNGSNLSGFNALPAGRKKSSKSQFTFLGNVTNFWTSSHYSNVDPVTGGQSANSLSLGGNELVEFDEYGMGNAFSARCVRD